MTAAPEPPHARLVELVADTLRRDGFVDPDDGTVPMWPDRERPTAVWVSPMRLAASIAIALQPYVAASALEAICSRCGLRGHFSAWCLNDNEPAF